MTPEDGGQGGAWADEAISTGIILAGFSSNDHALCAAGNCDAVHAELIAAGRPRRQPASRSPS